MLENVGIIGWSHLEVPLLACILSRYPILLVGKHGHNKTDGAEILSRAALGVDAKFQAYNVNLIQPEDLMGYANPYSLKEGKSVSYVPTEISVWNARAILLDEINRASPFSASKVMELIRTRKVMGMETELELVFASANPPAVGYDTIYMDPATVSRFAVFSVPDRLSSEDLLRVLSIPPDLEERAPQSGLKEVSEVLSRASSCLSAFSDKERHEVRKIVAKVVQALYTEISLDIVPRTARAMVSVLLSLEALSQASPGLVQESDKMKAIYALIPEVSGLCRSTVSKSVVRSQVDKVLSGFRLRDAFVMASSLEDLLDDSVSKDLHVWAASALSYVQSCYDSSALCAFMSGLTKMAKEGSLGREVYNSVFGGALSQYLSLDTSISKPTLVEWDREGFSSFVYYLGNSGELE